VGQPRTAAEWRCDAERNRTPVEGVATVATTPIAGRAADT